MGCGDKYKKMYNEYEDTKLTPEKIVSSAKMDVKEAVVNPEVPKVAEDVIKSAKAEYKSKY